MTIQGIVTFLPLLRLRHNVRKSIARENNWQMMDQTDRQFINPDEGVAYSSVYYLNIPINKRVLYICWQQLFLLIIYWFMGKGASSLTHALCTSTNSLSVQGHISLPCAQSRRNGLRRQCERTGHFAQIEEVRSSSLMRVQIYGVWPRAVMLETAEMAGPAAEKKIGRWQCKPRDSHDKLPMCWFDHAYAQKILENYCFSSSYGWFLLT